VRDPPQWLVEAERAGDPPHWLVEADVTEVGPTNKLIILIRVIIQ
jgi:hypothetical protein